MDWRLLVVLIPVLIAGSWAIYNIGTLAIAQAQKFLNKES